jgi:hypothetical protein
MCESLLNILFVRCYVYQHSGLIMQQQAASIVIFTVSRALVVRWTLCRVYRNRYYDYDYYY